MTSQAPLKIFLALAILVVVTSVSYGIFLVAPWDQRTFRFDQRRVSDLTSISRAVDAYWSETDTLPEQLSDLEGRRRTYIQSIEDPETSEPYEYRVLSEKGFELCAVFTTDSASQRREYPPAFSERVWEHSAGRVCFGLEAQSTGERIR
ncbi:MAG: hypothetical protein CMJ45_09390 [Planctomyces sp.]|nr:hypothetical protein [Planctomyces sp.]